jgi:hypothetical protein
MLIKLMTGIEAAYRYPDKMFVVEMTLEKEVELMVDMLRKLTGDVTVELGEIRVPHNEDDASDGERIF